MDKAKLTIAMQSYVHPYKSDVSELVMIAQIHAELEVKKAVAFYHEFHNKLEERVNEEDSDVMKIGEFVMNYFNLWK